MHVLVIIVPYKISELIEKGELSPRYFNPGNLFEEIHIILTNDDRVDKDIIRKTIGNASITIHNFPTGHNFFIRTLGWRPSLMKKWAAPVIKLVKNIRPSLIRCYGDDLNLFLADRIKDTLGIPYIVSLHTCTDKVIDESYRDKIKKIAAYSYKRKALRAADLVLPVYESIVPYLRRIGVKNYTVVYNVINPINIKQKKDFSLHQPVKVISVSRQIKGKNPENIIRAIARLPNTHLTLVGDGPLHNYLKDLVVKLKLQERVQFIPSIDNDELCSSLIEYDFFAARSDYLEISKSVLEPLLSGLPTVINKTETRITELEGDHILKVSNDEEGYFQAFNRLICDEQFREWIGKTAYSVAQEKWSPEKMENKIVQIIKNIACNVWG